MQSDNNITHRVEVLGIVHIAVYLQAVDLRSGRESDGITG